MRKARLTDFKKGLNKTKEELLVYKKVVNSNSAAIVELVIPKGTRYYCHFTQTVRREEKRPYYKKIRFEKAGVLAIFKGDWKARFGRSSGYTEFLLDFNHIGYYNAKPLLYEVGMEISIRDFDTRSVSCSTGIHAFHDINIAEAWS